MTLELRYDSRGHAPHSRRIIRPLEIHAAKAATPPLCFGLVDTARLPCGRWCLAWFGLARGGAVMLGDTPFIAALLALALAASMVGQADLSRLIVHPDCPTEAC